MCFSLFAFSIKGFHLCPVSGPAHTCRTCLSAVSLLVYLKPALVPRRLCHVGGFSPAAPVFYFRTIMDLWRACACLCACPPTCPPSVVLSRFCLLEAANLIFGHDITVPGEACDASVRPVFPSVELDWLWRVGRVSGTLSAPSLSPFAAAPPPRPECQ